MMLLTFGVAAAVVLLLERLRRRKDRRRGADWPARAAAAMLVLLGCARMAADVAGFHPLRVVADATQASPAMTALAPARCRSRQSALSHE